MTLIKRDGGRRVTPSLSRLDWERSSGCQESVSGLARVDPGTWIILRL